VEGQDPATHVVMLVTCLIGYQLGTDEPVYEDHYEVVEKGSAPPRVLPAPDPAVLAASAWAQMPLPKPGVHRSPSESNHDPAHGNLPFTWVNLPTWFWADAGVWAPQTLTVSLRGVSVTATGVPVSLTYTPGDGGTPAVCDGPGRAWTEADGNAPPAAGSGGCAYTYRDVTANGPITSSVSLTWRGSWTSNTGASGSLGEVTVSSTSAPFLVEQIQVMLR
jgi:hypothetical protein